MPKFAYVLTGHPPQSSPTPNETVPAGQATQAEYELLPAETVYMPAGHGVHVPEPASVLYVLAGHRVHPSPLPVVNEPLGQGTQAAELVLAVRLVT